MYDPLSIPGVTDSHRFGVDELNNLLVWLTDQGGSDAVVKTADVPFVQIDGDWRRVGNAPILPSDLANVVQHIHQESSIAAMQGAVPLNFRHVIKVRRGVRYGFRANAVAGASSRADMGIKLTFRSIPSQPPSFDDLDFEQVIRDNSMPSFGLVLVSGPTGSGKSTTLASIIRYRLEHYPENIQTFEAPIEFDYEQIKNRVGVCFQTEIGPHLPTFESAVAEMLRMAPNVGVIGEARDRATIEGVVRAAITGHGVYSTTHTNSVAITVPRMTDNFPEDGRWAMAVNIIDAMRLSIHQRLVRRPDGGRVALREILVYDDDVRRRLFAAGAAEYMKETQRLVESYGQPLIEDAARKFEAGHIAERDYRRLEAELRSDRDDKVAAVSVPQWGS